MKQNLIKTNKDLIRLMGEVLDRALADYRLSLSRQMIDKENEDYIFGKTNNNYLFSFENVARCVGYNPDELRAGLLARKEEI